MKKRLLSFILCFSFFYSFSQIANQPSDLLICDDDTNDGIALFDLTVLDAQVLGNQNSADFTLTYHLAQSDANNGNNSVLSPFANLSNPQTMYVRLEENSSGNFDTTSFYIIVNLLPDAGADGVIALCSNEGSIDLFNSLGGSPQPGGTWSPALASGTGIYSPSIDSAGTYTYTVSEPFCVPDDSATVTVMLNQSPTFSISDVSICEGSSTQIDTGLDPSQHTFLWSTGETTSTILVSQEGSYLVSVTNLEGCLLETGFNVTFDGPSFNQPNPLYSCDFTGNGTGEFDLTQATSEIIGGQADLSVTYYATQAEAEEGLTSIVDEFPYANIVPNNQLLYFRVESSIDGCFAIGSLELVISEVAPLPNISDYVVCDEDQDGFTEFSLQSKNDEVLVNQDNLGLVVSYHLTGSDAANLANELPNFYINTTNPQTIYVAVNTINDCGAEVQSFNLVADQTCMSCQTITASIDSTIPEVNASGIVVTLTNEEITFNGSAMFSNDGANAIYTWDFGDNTSVIGESVNHQYIESGNYLVTLTVTDASLEECSSTAIIQAEIIGENLVVDQSQFTVEELVQNVLIGNECSQISNITFSTGSLNGQDPNGIGYFLYEGNDFPFSEGLILSTGDANDAEGPNDTNASSGSNNWPGDVDLDATLGIQSNNATYIEFDFVPVINQINFEFLMASEEYDGGPFECQFSDAFAFLLTDAMGNTTNLAIIPGTDIPITIANIHNANSACEAANSEFFGGYIPQDSPPIAYNGRTITFTAQADVNIGETYHIKLVIADDSDTVFDSAVFFNAGSFDVGGICEDTGLISMRAFNDLNTNSSYDIEDESRFNNGSFTYEKNNDGVINYVNSSNGTFTIVSTDENDTYDVTFTVNDDYTDCYTQPVTTFSDINVAFGVLAQIDFPVEDNLTCEDLAVYLINPFATPRPGFEHTNLLILENLSGATIASGSVEFLLDDNLLINNIAFNNTNISISTTATGFTLDFTNFGPSQTETVDITLLCPASVELGEIVTNSASYVTVSNDTVLENNLSTLSEIVIGSYDPNDKAESLGPEIVYDDFITTDEYLYYTIRFQNVGTAEAIFIRIEDELDQMLDETTFQMLRASHDYMVTRTDSSLEWFFDDINLPAEQDDAEGSNGFVYFKIKPKAGYNLGDIIPNTASIYFDFNAPIITNTFTTTFVETLSSSDFEIVGFRLFPNPAKNNVTIELNNSLNDDLSIKIYDISGKQIGVSTTMNSQSIELDVSELSSGLYFVQLSNAITSLVEKFVID